MAKTGIVDIENKKRMNYGYPKNRFTNTNESKCGYLKKKSAKLYILDLDGRTAPRTAAMDTFR